MEKSSKILLKHILDIDMEFCKIEKVFHNKNFLPVTKITVDIPSDPVRLILNAFNISDDAKGEKIFHLFDDFYEEKITTQDTVNKIEEILKQ